MSDNGPDGDQYDAEDHNTNSMLDQPHLEDVPEGVPLLSRADRSTVTKT